MNTTDTETYAPITQEQAIEAPAFHHNTEVYAAGGCRVYKRNGTTQLWKRKPDAFRTPIKFGLKGTAQLTQDNASHFHLPSDCQNEKGQ